MVRHVAMLNKVASANKYCARNKSSEQIETASLVNISFNRSKGDELVPNVVPNNIDELRPFCNVDPVRNSVKIRKVARPETDCTKCCCVKKYDP